MVDKSSAWKAAGAVFVLFVSAAIPSHAQTFTTLATFTSGTTGSPSPYARLVQGTDGNFYGTTEVTGGGTFFRVTAAGSLTTLYTFGSAPFGGEGPNGVIQATDGNFYGAAGNT